MKSQLPIAWEHRLICSDCFFELFPDASPFYGVGLWSPTVLNFDNEKQCFFCYCRPMLLDVLEELE